MQAVEYQIHLCLLLVFCTQNLYKNVRECVNGREADEEKVMIGECHQVTA